MLRDKSGRGGRSCANSDEIRMCEPAFTLIIHPSLPPLFCISITLPRSLSWFQHSCARVLPNTWKRTRADFYKYFLPYKSSRSKYQILARSIDDPLSANYDTPIPSYDFEKGKTRRIGCTLNCTLLRFPKYSIFSHPLSRWCLLKRYRQHQNPSMKQLEEEIARSLLSITYYSGITRNFK